jgi:hypothetical protein
LHRLSKLERTEENDAEEDCPATLVAWDDPVRYSNSGADCQGSNVEALSENGVCPGPSLS